MKENYNHKNRHKYYLKCHLIFCIKYRRKICTESLMMTSRQYFNLLQTIRILTLT